MIRDMRLGFKNGRTKIMHGDNLSVVFSESVLGALKGMSTWFFRLTFLDLLTNGMTSIPILLVKNTKKSEDFFIFNL